MAGMGGVALAVLLVALDGLEGQTIWVNPQEVVSVRTPTSDLLHSDVKCALQTVDGKIINVVDDCGEVRRRLGAR